MTNQPVLDIEQQQATFVNKLALHQSRRNQSIPTLSVLTGGTAAAQLLWKQWAQQDSRHTASCTYESALSLFEMWLFIIAQHYDLQSLALERVSQLSDRSAKQLASWLTDASEYQTGQFWRQLCTQSEQGHWLKLLLDQAKSPRRKFREALSVEGIELEENDLAAITRIFILVFTLLPESTAPGILIRLPAESHKSPSRQMILVTLTQLVEAIPKIPIGLLLLPEQADELLNTLPESRMKATVRGGMVKITAPGKNELQQWLSSRGLKSEEHLQSIVQTGQRYGATEAILSAALSLTKPAEKGELAAEGEENYRSQAEWLLFQYLEARPATAGQFQVNARLDIRFGSRSMEVDFLADRARIVVELDGYYHFQATDSYRRDRRKDIALQQAGFWVLRFLSEDVVAHLEDILSTIDRALSLRLAQSSAQRES